MPELFVSHQGKKYFSAAMRSERFTLGRSQENDLVLTGEGVSRRHAKIEKRDGAYWISDESAQGTLLNGEPLGISRALKTRDRIGIDSWSIEFHDRQVTDTPPAALESPAEPVTKVIQDHAAAGSGPDDPVPNLLIVRDPQGGHSRYPVRKKCLTVGSSSECDIVVPDEYVSRRHALLALTERGFTVADLDSTNGTFIDGARIREAFLNGDREIGLGRSRLRVCFRKPREGAEEPGSTGGFFGIVGESPVMLELFTLLTKIAATDMTALILGPTGSGKERVAGVLHELSARREKPFVALNCGAIASGLAESELFGHEKGAFTGALERHAGAFEQAHGGTLFLDEIGELSLQAQAQILRAIEYGRVRRVGADQETRVDVRILAATHRDLAELATRGKFREDLFYRLYVLPLSVPPLRERADDAALLARHFLALSGRSGAAFDACAMAKIRAHDWPGNVRELRNAVLRAAALAESEKIRAGDLVLANPFSSAAPQNASIQTFPDLTPEDRAEAEKIRSALRQSGNDKNAAARLLCMGRSTLFRRIKILGI